MSEPVANPIFEVTDGKITVPAELLLGGENYNCRQSESGQYELVHMPRRDRDGSQSILILEESHTALREFCNQFGRGSNGHRPDLTLTVSALMMWVLKKDEGEMRTIVQEFGQRLYRGEVTSTLGEIRPIRLLKDAAEGINRFATNMAEVLGGMRAERTLVLTALTGWAVRQEDADDVVDEYIVDMSIKRLEERKAEKAKAKAQTNGDSTGDPTGEQRAEVDNDQVNEIVTDEALPEKSTRKR